ncbi:efflux RND transporter periplasmic adaptor subunit [Luteolibacter sp. AS25]|uniref:efflux RND transporter periplasmic adaptor subunit n=1 Tax=Luteolibacter sp. AS25 TaxID=3135776 RepID=UPI00398A6271
MKVALKIIIPIAILILAVIGYKFLGSLKPAPQSKQPREVVPIVNLSAISPSEHTPPIKSYGTVKSYYETSLAPQVSGSITFVSESFRVGKMVEEGEILVKIDPTDYKAALAQQESVLTLAERTYAEEEIRAEQASGDWKASGRRLEDASDFVLRKPQLSATRADIESAKALIEKAQADLDRTEVRAPFAAIVTARVASPGNQASSQSSLGTLVSTEKVEIRLPLTADQAFRVEIPTKAKLSSPLKPDETWDAELVRMEPTVDEQNQVIYAVAEVSNPFSEGKKALPVGMFANATIDAKPIPASYEVPEAAFVEDRFVWYMDENQELQRLVAKRVHSADGMVYLQPEEEKGELQVVTRPLSNFRAGMKVKAAEEAETE